MTSQLNPAPPLLEPALSRLLIPWNARRIGLALFAVVSLVLSLLSLRFIEFSLFDIIDGFRTSGYLGRAFPPSFENLSASLNQVGRTFMMAAAGTGLAGLLSFPLGFLSARNTTPASWIGAVARAIIVATRAIPDLVFAVFFVAALSIGELPGVLALGFHSIGMLGKLLADSIEQIDPGPVEAARSAGAGPLQVIANAVVPQVSPGYLGNLLYRLDINTRSSAVLGFVGAGGIGMELRQNLRNPLRYPVGIGQALLIMGLILIVDRVSNRTRRSLEGITTIRSNDRETSTDTIVDPATARMTPPWTRDRVLLTSITILLLSGFAYSAIRLGLNPISFVRSLTKSAETSKMFFPPDFSTSRSLMVTGFAESLAIGLAATFLGLLFAVPMAIVVARTTTPNRWLGGIAGAVLVFFRAIPELVIVLLFVSAVGLGPLPGAIALSIGMFAFITKLLADRIEGLPPGPTEGVTATGASRSQVVAASVTPQMMPTLVGTGLYAFDVCVRSSAVLGLVGAGGIGQLLDETIAFLQYEIVAAIIITLFVIVLIIEQLSGLVRKFLL